MTSVARRVLALCETDQTSGSLAKALGLSTARVQRAVKELEADDLITHRAEGGVLRYRAR